MENLKIKLFTLILVILVSISCYFFYCVIFSKSNSTFENQLKPDVIVNNLTSLNYDKNGNIAMNLSTPLMKYNSFSKNAILSTPHIIVYQTNNTPWIITANIGHVLDNFALFKLIGNVKLNQAATTKTLSTMITTSELNIHLNTHIADTDQYLTFTQINTDHSQISVKAKGANVNQKTGEVKLFSKTQGVYNYNAK